MASDSYEIQWAPIALEDLQEILSYVAVANNPGVAERLAWKIVRRVQSLKTHPGRCRVVPELREIGVREYRELIIPPYRVFIRIAKRKVRVVGVLDGRRDLEEILIQRALGE